LLKEMMMTQTHGDVLCKALIGEKPSSHARKKNTSLNSGLQA